MAGWTLAVRPSGDVRMTLGDRERVLREEQLLGDSDYLCSWVDPGKQWLVLIGLRGTHVVHANTRSGPRVIDTLCRAIIQGAYDPGGLQHVEFVGTPGGVVIIYEAGACYVRADGRVPWNVEIDEYVQDVLPRGDAVELFTEDEVLTLDPHKGLVSRRNL